VFPPEHEAEIEAEQRHVHHAESDPIPAPPIRTVLVDLATELECGFWDAPLWLPIGGMLQGGDDLWEIVSVRLVLPLAGPGARGRPVLYLYARRAEP
jgi:hypothetical protein